MMRLLWLRPRRAAWICVCCLNHSNKGSRTQSGPSLPAVAGALGREKGVGTCFRWSALKSQPFDEPFDGLRVPSQVEGLRAVSNAEPRPLRWVLLGVPFPLMDMLLWVSNAHYQAFSEPWVLEQPDVHKWTRDKFISEAGKRPVVIQMNKWLERGCRIERFIPGLPV